MILEVYSVFDSKAKAFMQPWYAANQFVALRHFVSAVNDPATVFYKHPSDFVLYRLGSFNDETGVLWASDQLLNLGLAATFKTREVANENAS